MDSPREPSSISLNETREMARLLADELLGGRPKKLIYKASGHTNFVFEVLHRKGRFVIRLNSDVSRADVFRKEQWAIQEVRKVGVPASEIIAVGNDIVPAAYMLSEWIPGREVAHHPDRDRILPQIGEYAARINSVATKGFGRRFDWSECRFQKHRTWHAFLKHALHLDSRLELLAKHGSLKPRQIDRLRSALENVGSRKPSLNHGDLRLKNVLVDDDLKITAIIDWENCLSSLAPEWDLSVALHDRTIDEKQQFLHGYGLSQREIRERAPLIKAINIINYAPHLENLDKSGDRATIEIYRTRLSGALDLYSI